MAAAALAAGNRDASHELLYKALKDEIQTPDELHWAPTVTYSLGDLEMIQQLLEVIKLPYLDSNLTREGEFI